MRVKVILHMDIPTSDTEVENQVLKMLPEDTYPEIESWQCMGSGECIQIGTLRVVD